MLLKHLWVTRQERIQTLIKWLVILMLLNWTSPSKSLQTYPKCSMHRHIYSSLNGPHGTNWKQTSAFCFGRAAQTADQRAKLLQLNVSGEAQPINLRVKCSAVAFTVQFTCQESQQAVYKGSRQKRLSALLKEALSPGHTTRNLHISDKLWWN